MTLIVEGRYDKSRLSGITDLPVICTDGFGVFSDSTRLALIKQAALNGGVLILTDSDRAGFQIRRKLTDVCKSGTVLHAYIPDIFGKEKRKTVPSKEGKIGVEGVPDNILRGIISKAVKDTESSPTPYITKQRLYIDGLTGTDNSADKRAELCRSLGLPVHIGANALVMCLNNYFTEEEYLRALDKV
ncbi:MAG: DUF4093 domain-containing protein [Oscillospiraceae bacterium]|jgi:ribonuclease M5|nr:DUF4093 domain-containing protein [Oscillospiraceae bacterium]